MSKQEKIREGLAVLMRQQKYRLLGYEDKGWFNEAQHTSYLESADELMEFEHKAGAKEVVDFIGKEPFEHNYFSDDCFACKWEAKLKEWGIEPLIEVKDETRTTE